MVLSGGGSFEMHGSILSEIHTVEGLVYAEKYKC